MIAIDLLSEVVPAINKNDKASEALNWMDVFKVSHLPIVDNDEYIGIISDADIFDMNMPETPIVDQCITLKRPFVTEDQHILEITDLIAKHKLSTLPVLDKDENYIGLIRAIDLIQELAHLMSTENIGGIIVLELNPHDYALSEIGQIIESNDAKILSLYTQSNQKLDKLEITIKTNRTDLSAIIQTFERYNYIIKAVIADNQEVDALLQNRIDSFFKYLNI